MILGNLFIITAASGAGKTSLIKALLIEDPQLKLSISHTTRQPRPGETNGVDYHFVDESSFVRMLGEDQFLESALVHGAHYGTSRSSVDTPLATGADVSWRLTGKGLSKYESYILRQLVFLYCHHRWRL